MKTIVNILTEKQKQQYIHGIIPSWITLDDSIYIVENAIYFYTQSVKNKEEFGLCHAFEQAVSYYILGDEYETNYLSMIGIFRDYIPELLRIADEHGAARFSSYWWDLDNTSVRLITLRETLAVLRGKRRFKWKQKLQ